MKDADRGLVDFPSLRDGEVVELCWLDGEPEVAHWHHVGAGFAGPPAAGVGAEPNLAGAGAVGNGERDREEGRAPAADGAFPCSTSTTTTTS